MFDASSIGQSAAGGGGGLLGLLGLLGGGGGAGAGAEGWIGTPPFNPNAPWPGGGGDVATGTGGPMDWRQVLMQLAQSPGLMQQQQPRTSGGAMPPMPMPASSGMPPGGYIPAPSALDRRRERPQPSLFRGYLSL